MGASTNWDKIGMRNVSRFIVFFAMFGASLAATAGITPANLGGPEAERYLLRFIEFPETHGDAEVRLQCVAIIKGSGKMQDAGCFIRNNWDPDFAEAVQKASEKAAFAPAMDGKKGKRIAMMFRVEFLKTGDEKTINVFLNPGVEEMLEAYGQDHISAQRVMGKETWQKACPRHARWLVHVRAHVNEEGVASSVDLVHGGGIVPTGTCQQALIETITLSPFAPATVGGEPVPSSYEESFGH